MIHGRVIKGQGIGKKHGLPPTMNIEVAANQPELEALKQGIYCVKVRRTGTAWLPGVAHYGPRPAVNAPDSFEIHIFDFNEEWYGANVEVQMGEYLRPIENFAKIEELKTQIEKDIVEGRKLSK